MPQDLNDKTLLETEDKAQEPMIGSVIADRYRLVARLGAGGMGEVYKAEHVALRMPIAVKFLHSFASTDREMVARFEREARAVANIDSPHVVKAIDFNRLPDGKLYLAMEYVEGATLAKVLRDCPRLPPQRAYKILRQIGAALSRAHALGVVHRDVKPENVILTTRDGETDFVKVVDFGIARVRSDALGSVSTALTQAGMVFGTPAYLSPEQALGQPVDARADQYALGVVAFQMLTGRLPFGANDTLGLMQQHLMAEVPRVTQFAPELPSAVDAVVARMMGKRPSDRFASVESAVAALGAALEGVRMPDAPQEARVHLGITASNTALPALTHASASDTSTAAAGTPAVNPTSGAADSGVWTTSAGAGTGAMPPSAGTPAAYAPTSALTPAVNAIPASSKRRTMLIAGIASVLGLAAFAGVLTLRWFGSPSGTSSTQAPQASGGRDGAAAPPVTQLGLQGLTVLDASAPLRPPTGVTRAPSRGCREGRCVCRNTQRCSYVCNDDPCDALCEDMRACEGQCGDHCTLRCLDGQRCNLRCGDDCHATCSDVHDCRVSCTENCQVDCSLMMSCVVRMRTGEAVCGERVGGCDVQCQMPDGHFERASRCGRGRYRCPPGPC